MSRSLTSLGAIEQRTLADMVTARIRDAIRRGELEPGQRLTEPELAESLDVSRSPVRVALARLKSEGLIIGDSSRYVWKPTQDDVDEVFSLRNALNALAVRWLIDEDRLNDEDFERLQSLIDELERDAERGMLMSPASIIAMEEAFWGHLHQKSGHTLVARLWRQTSSQWHLFMYRYLNHYEQREIAQRMIEAYQTVLELLRRADLDQAMAEYDVVNHQRIEQIRQLF
jgi:DNA-binding GntR family transcriptional regulator